MTARFVMPEAGASAAVRFPPMVREVLANGLDVRVITQPTIPAFTAMLVIQRGTSGDPAGKHGLASLTADLVDEGAGARDAIALAEAVARLGAQFDIDAGPDATWISITSLERHLEPALELLADVAARPRLTDEDFQRVRELRVNRLRQLSRSTGAIADRIFVSTVFGDHPYGHGAMGTTAALAGMTVEDARQFWASFYRPRAATLIVGGAVSARSVMHAAEASFGRWLDTGDAPDEASRDVERTTGRIWLVDKPGAPQSEIRVGHLGPPRQTASYHALVTLNALLGGQFTSRINRRLREEKGVTYGARTSFDFRRLSGSFSCDTSVQADATAAAVSDVLAEYEDIRRGGITADELGHAQASLTRGYVRHFETTVQIVRGAAQMVTYDLSADVFDRFVPSVEAVSAADVQVAAQSFIHPADATIVVVGDASVCQEPLEAVGRGLTLTTAEF